MSTVEQICVSLKSNERELWKKLVNMYPKRSKHDIVWFGLKLLYKYNLKRKEARAKQMSN